MVIKIKMIGLENLIKFIFKFSHLFLLVLILFLAIFLRWFTSNFNIIFDYDPWWFYRHAKNLLENNFIPQKWDILSYYPPGRPVDFYLGWSYTLALAYFLVCLLYTSDAADE